MLLSGINALENNTQKASMCTDVILVNANKRYSKLSFWYMPYMRSTIVSSSCHIVNGLCSYNNCLDDLDTCMKSRLRSSCAVLRKEVVTLWSAS